MEIMRSISTVLCMKIQIMPQERSELLTIRSIWIRLTNCINW